MNINSKSKLIEAILLVIVFISLIWHGNSKIDRTPFHIDEAHKISETYYYNLFFIQHDLTNSNWHDDFYARTNPTVAKFIMGAFLNIHGRVITDLSLQEKFEKYWKDPQYLYQQIPQGLIIITRRLSVILSAMTLIVVYLIGRLSGNIITGILSALLLACNPFFRYYGSVALTDILLIFFMYTMIVFCLFSLKYLLKNNSNRSRIIFVQKMTLFIILATIIAASAGTKLNGALTGIFLMASMFTVFIIDTIFNKSSLKLHSFFNFILFPLFSIIMSLIIFVLLNPYLYKSPISKIFSILNTYHDWMLKQSIDPGQPLWTITQKITAIGIFDFAIPQSLLFPNRLPILFMIFILGNGYLVLSIWDALAMRKLPLWQCVMILCGIIYGFGIGFWIPVTWDRYFFPLAPLIAIITSYGLISFCKSVYALRKIARFSNRQKISTAYNASKLFIFLFGGGIIWYIIMDRSFVSPEIFLRNNESPSSILATYNDVRTTNSNNPLKLMYAADAKMMSNDPWSALPLYKKALVIFRANHQNQTTRVMTALCQEKLSSILYKMSQIDSAIIMYKSYIDSLKNITRFLKSKDPKVIDEFNQIIKEREIILENFQHESYK